MDQIKLPNKIDKCLIKIKKNNQNSKYSKKNDNPNNSIKKNLIHTFKSTYGFFVLKNKY